MLRRRYVALWVLIILICFIINCCNKGTSIKKLNKNYEDSISCIHECLSKDWFYKIEISDRKERINIYYYKDSIFFNYYINISGRPIKKYYASYDTVKVKAFYITKKDILLFKQCVLSCMSLYNRKKFFLDKNFVYVNAGKKIEITIGEDFFHYYKLKTKCFISINESFPCVFDYLNYLKDTYPSIKDFLGKANY